jgi:hypothetical protein
MFFYKMVDLTDSGDKYVTAGNSAVSSLTPDCTHGSRFEGVYPHPVPPQREGTLAAEFLFSD